MDVLLKHILIRLFILLIITIVIVDFNDVTVVCKLFNMFIFSAIIYLTIVKSLSKAKDWLFWIMVFIIDIFLALTMAQRQREGGNYNDIIIFSVVLNLTMVKRLSQQSVGSNTIIGWLFWVMMYMIIGILVLEIAKFLGDGNFMILVAYCIFVYIFPTTWISKPHHHHNTFTPTERKLLEIFDNTMFDSVCFLFVYLLTLLLAIYVYSYDINGSASLNVYSLHFLQLYFLSKYIIICVKRKSIIGINELSLKDSFQIKQDAGENVYESYILQIYQKFETLCPVICLLYILGVNINNKSNRYLYIASIQFSNNESSSELHLIRLTIITFFDYKSMYHNLKHEIIIFIEYFVSSFHYVLIYKKFYSFYRLVKYMILVVINSVAFLFVIFSLGEYLLRSLNSQMQYSDYHLNDNGYNTTDISNELSDIKLVNLGDDTVLVCYFQHPADYTWSINQITWFHNDTIMKEGYSRRRTIHNFRNKGNGNIILRSVLIIPVTQCDDFGMYTCTIEFVTIEKIHFKHDHSYKYHVQNFHIIPKVENSMAFYIKQGNCLSYQALYYLTIAEENEITVKYTVNEEDIHDLCRWKIMSCNIVAYMSCKMDKSFTPFTVTFVQITSWQKIMMLEFRMCMCSSMYGIHEVTIYREIYNGVSNKSEIQEIIFPIKTFFYPTENDSFINEDLFARGLANDILSLILEGRDNFDVPLIFGFKISLNVFALANYTFICLIFVSMYALLKISNIIVKTYCQVTIVPFRNRLLFGTWHTPTPSIQSPIFAGIQSLSDIRYDVFISYCDSDYDFALNTVLPFVEDACSLNAYFPDRDLSHNAGVSKLHLYTKATQQSRVFLVVLTKEYVNDPDCHDLQLQRCILPLLCEHKTNHRNALIVLRLDRSVQIPVQIKWDPDVSIIDMFSPNNFDDVKSELKRKLYSF